MLDAGVCYCLVLLPVFGDDDAASDDGDQPHLSGDGPAPGVPGLPAQQPPVLHDQVILPVYAIRGALGEGAGGARLGEERGGARFEERAR